MIELPGNFSPIISREIFTISKQTKIISGCAGVVCIGILTLYSIILSWKIHCVDPERIITIPQGASAKTVATLLKHESCLKSESLFRLALTITMKNKRLIPGRYTFKGISTIGQLVKVITSPSRDRIKVTLIEGWTIEQISEELKNRLQINTYKFIELTKDYNFAHSLGIDAPSLEGFLFPDTYIMLKTYTEEEIIRVLVNQFKHNIKNKLKSNKGNISLNLREITTLASIIQGEAVFNDEMPTISSVYHNRLKRNMLLQADPTIQYIIPGKNRRLYNKDLNIDNPYNTYKYKGLPPGPINNPGLDAFMAAVNPASSPYLYFVANGEGRHIFSRTNAEHNAAKTELRQSRRKARN